MEKDSILDRYLRTDLSAPVTRKSGEMEGDAPGYGDFPAQKVEADPGFSLLYFSLACVVALIITLVLVFPGWFGFKKTEEAPGNRGRPPLSLSGSGGACRCLRLAGS